MLYDMLYCCIHEFTKCVICFLFNFRKLYWIDAKIVGIFVSELNGTSMKTLLKKSILRRPRALVVHPVTG